MLTHGELADTLYKIERHLEEVIYLHLRRREARNPRSSGKGNGSPHSVYDHWVERAVRQRAGIHAIARSLLSAPHVPQVPELDFLENLLEKQQDIISLLDRLIAHTPEPAVLGSLREFFMDAVDDWDAITRRIEQLQAPKIEQRGKTRMRTLGDLTIMDEIAELTVKGRCLDFSYDGLSALVCAHLPVGARYTLEFSIMGRRDPAKAMGQVRWCRLRTSGDAWRIGFQLVA